MNLDTLLALEPNSSAWEAERERLCLEAINSAPPELRAKLITLQASLDAAREVMSPEEFMRHILLELQENLANLQDQFLALKVVLEKGV